MYEQTEAILSGVGGQGLIVCGTLLGEAAVLVDGKNAVLSSEYGVETRGTFAKSDILVSTGEIYYPESTKPNLVLCLSQVAYQRYAGLLPAETLLVYDADQVKPLEGALRQEGIHITQMARSLGIPAAANIVAMGIVARRTQMITPEAGKCAIRRFFQRRGEAIVAANIKAFELGYSA